ncbi:hypothetical protein CPB85DRAFT_1327665 [Mucidula mucida]|nr:hypothetical protein CPB85DRAFT_1327665 [Mucidula mucida]
MFSLSWSIELHPFILLAFCHGIHICVFLIAIYYIIESTQPHRNRITLTSIMIHHVLMTVILSLNWEITGVFIAHGTSLEIRFFTVRQCAEPEHANDDHGHGEYRSRGTVRACGQR